MEIVWAIGDEPVFPTPILAAMGRQDFERASAVVAAFESGTWGDLRATAKAEVYDLVCVHLGHDAESDDPSDHPPGDAEPIRLEDVDVYEPPWPIPFESMTRVRDIADLARDDERVAPVLQENQLQIEGRARIEEVLQGLTARGHTLTHDEGILYLFPGYW